MPHVLPHSPKGCRNRSAVVAADFPEAAGEEGFGVWGLGFRVWGLGFRV